MNTSKKLIEKAKLLKRTISERIAEKRRVGAVKAEARACKEVGPALNKFITAPQDSPEKHIWGQRYGELENAL